ncbi:protein kinase-like protein [Aspergillus welwitschiae]|uniref:Protein kinase-like protein n=1 Tax=Aspergillus welwitschiae TaxID=1341132 RepID=A0A3F3Q0S8_9EURO|nr:protein kinase-like protein [Aspergillus welwitschiae]RDH32627.1 protein kinase-like protein [Aspergillus welwitschiae]
MRDAPKLGPINDCALYRILTLLAIAALRKFRPFKGSVLMLTDRICVKYGQHVDLSEAGTMCFVSQNTSIPVPKVLCAFTHQRCTYIVMERIKGEMIGAGWVYRSEESKAKILTQLQKMVREMRTLPPPAGMGVQEFHRHLRGGMDFDPGLDPAIQELIRQHDRSFPIKFTHGDLTCQVNPQNSFWINEIDKFITPMPDELAMERIRQKFFGDY